MNAERHFQENFNGLVAFSKQLCCEEEGMMLEEMPHK
jgi:hypothetical protein